MNIPYTTTGFRCYTICPYDEKKKIYVFSISCEQCGHFKGNTDTYVICDMEPDPILLPNVSLLPNLPDLR